MAAALRPPSPRATVVASPSADRTDEHAERRRTRRLAPMERRLGAFGRARGVAAARASGPSVWPSSKTAAVWLSVAPICYQGCQPAAIAWSKRIRSVRVHWTRVAGPVRSQWKGAGVGIVRWDMAAWKAV